MHLTASAMVTFMKDRIKRTDKVIRGGSWYHNASEMRVTNRNFTKPYTKNGYLGFRVARSYNPR